KLRELGWSGMAIPEEYGGTGNSLTDVAVLLEELGAGPVPGPLFSSGVLCARIVMEVATEEQRKAWLPHIASGERVFALAQTEARYGWSPEHVALMPRRDGNAFVLNGTKLFVHDAVLATDLLVVARSPAGTGTSLLRVDAKAPGVAIRPLEGFLTGLSEVKFENARVAGQDLLGKD